MITFDDFKSLMLLRDELQRVTFDQFFAPAVRFVPMNARIVSISGFGTFSMRTTGGIRWVKF